MDLPVLLGILVTVAFLAVILILVFTLKTIKFNKSMITQQEALAAYESGLQFSAKQTEAVNATLEERIGTFKMEYLAGIQNGSIALPTQLIAAVGQTDERLNQELHEARLTAANATKEAAETKGLLSSLKEISVKMRDRIAELETANQSLSAKNVELLNTNTTTQTSTADTDAGAELQLLCTSLGQGVPLGFAEAMQKIGQLYSAQDDTSTHEEIAVCKDRIDKMTERLGVLNKENGDLRDELARQEVASNENKAADTSAQITELKEECTRLQKVSEQQKAELAALRDAELPVAVQPDQVTMDALSSELNSCRQQLQTVQSELTRVQDELGKSGDENRKLLTKLEEAQTATATAATVAPATTEDSGKVIDLMSKINTLTAQLSQATSEAQQHRKEASVLTLKLSSAQAELQRLKDSPTDEKPNASEVESQENSVETVTPVTVSEEPPYTEAEYRMARHRLDNKNRPGAPTPKISDWTTVQKYEAWEKARAHNNN